VEPKEGSIRDEKLTENMQSLLTRWPATHRPGETERRRIDPSGSGNVEQVGEQLLDSPRSLGSVADHIKKALSRVEFDMSEDARSDELRQDARAVASLAERFAAPFYGESWTNDVDIGAGPWILHLTGSSRPTPQLTITLREYSVCGAVSHVGSAFAGL
jgi:hypothetical protein